MTWVPLILGLAQVAALVALVAALINHERVMRRSDRMRAEAFKKFREDLALAAAEAKDHIRRLDELT